MNQSNIKTQIRLLRSAPYILVIVLPINLAIAFYAYGRRNADGGQKLDKFHTVVNTVREYYVDGTEEKIGYDNLVDGALGGMLHKLDKHSHYLDRQTYRAAQESMEGEFAGIGIIFFRSDTAFQIRQVIPGGPAAEGGLRPDDLICFVDGQDIRGMTMDEAGKLLKGEEDSKVTLGIKRPSKDEDIDVTVTRKMIKLPSVKNVTYLSGNILYVQITQFNHNTAQELEATLFKNAQLMKGLILDVRNNPGGLLLSAKEICSFFLSPRDGLNRRKVVTTIPRKKENEYVHYVMETDPKYLDVPIAILVNANSASAAEILGGCLKDYGRATLVGTKTYGKGSVQQEINLGDGTAMRLTTAKYYTPSNIVIHEKGISPNITVNLNGEQEAMVQKVLMSVLEEKVMPDRDLQLAKALELFNSDGALR